jgi:lysophospholipase L1-like esterase
VVAVGATKLRLIAATLCLAAGSVGVFFGLIEGALRLSGFQPRPQPRILLRALDVVSEFPYMRPDPDLLWSPQPGFRGYFHDRPVSINRQGCRGPELARPKPPGMRRILCLGDSITFGFGVGEQENYPYLIGRALRKERVEVVNGGVNGYTSHQVLARFRRLAPLVEPDVVTVLVGWNDRVLRPVDDRGFERRLRWVVRVEQSLGRAYLFSAMQQVFRSAWPAAPAPNSVPRVSVAQYRENLAALVRACRSLGAAPLLIALPHRMPAPRASYASPHGDALPEIAKQLGIPLVGVGELGTREEQANNEALFVDSLHLSPLGNARMAERVVATLRAEGLLEEAAARSIAPK